MEQTMFKTLDEFFDNNKLLRKESVSINRRSNILAKDELDCILDIYLTYLRTPKEFIEQGITKYKINPANKRKGTLFLLVVLGTNKFSANNKKWDSRRYCEWASILTGWIEHGYTYSQAQKQINEKSKSAIISIFSDGIVKEPKFKNTIKNFRVVHKTHYGQSDYLIYVDNDGSITQLPRDAINLLVKEGYINVRN